MFIQYLGSEARYRTTVCSSSGFNLSERECDGNIIIAPPLLSLPPNKKTKKTHNSYDNKKAKACYQLDTNLIKALVTH